MPSSCVDLATVSWEPAVGSYVRVRQDCPNSDSRGAVLKVEGHNRWPEGLILSTTAVANKDLRLSISASQCEPWVPKEGDTVLYRGQNNILYDVEVVALPTQRYPLFLVKFFGPHGNVSLKCSLPQLQPHPASSPLPFGIKAALETEMEPISQIKPCPICECGDDYQKMPALEPDDCHPEECYEAFRLIRQQIKGGGSDGPHWRKQALKRVQEDVKDRALRDAQAQGAAASALNLGPLPEPEPRARWDWDPEDSLIT